jgi:hypothetical protein
MSRDHLHHYHWTGPLQGSPQTAQDVGLKSFDVDLDEFWRSALQYRIADAHGARRGVPFACGRWRGERALPTVRAGDKEL